ncbi:MAG TPA: sigma-70 family RNA polymerase sigma factor [Planctomycetota bacterium]|nr:sigma-70 family RNA polymerase sigma factor [Planctomycetota bacterium]
MDLNPAFDVAPVVGDDRTARYGLQDIIASRTATVRAVCGRILRRPSDVEDAVQETFIKFARSAERIHTNVDAWLCACARTTAMDTAKRLRGRSYRCAAMPAAVAAPDADARVDDDSLRALDQCLAELSPLDRRVVVAHVVNGRTQDDIADELRVSKAAVSKRLIKAMAALRAKLARRGVAASVAALVAMASARAQASEATTTAVAGAHAHRTAAGAVRRFMTTFAMVAVIVAAAVAMHRAPPAPEPAAAVAPPAAPAPEWKRIGDFPGTTGPDGLSLRATAGQLPRDDRDLRLSGRYLADPRVCGLRAAEPHVLDRPLRLTFTVSLPEVAGPHVAALLELYRADGSAAGAYMLGIEGAQRVLGQTLSLAEPDEAVDVVASMRSGEAIAAGTHQVEIVVSADTITATVDGRALPAQHLAGTAVAGCWALVYAASNPACADGAEVALSALRVDQAPPSPAH